MKPTCITCKANCHNAGTTSKIVDCSQYKPGRILTNADRIRAMTDEELAGIFLRADVCKCCEHEKGGVCNFICAYPNIPIYEGCRQAALKWMKQPVEVDT